MRNFLILICLATLIGCQPSEPYFSGANDFKVIGIAPEGVRFEAKLWYHNVLGQKADHMVENIYVHIGDEQLPVNTGEAYVITVGPNSRYDAPLKFFIPREIYANDPEESTLIANKSKNASFDIHLKGHGTLMVGDKPYKMPVDFKKTIKIWPDLD